MFCLLIINPFLFFYNPGCYPLILALFLFASLLVTSVRSKHTHSNTILRLSQIIVTVLNLTDRSLCHPSRCPHISVSKSSACNAGDLGSFPGLGRSLGEGNGNPLQYSCLENPMDRGAWQATVHGTARVRHNLATEPPPPCHPSPDLHYQKSLRNFNLIKWGHRKPQMMGFPLSPMWTNYLEQINLWLRYRLCLQKKNQLL